MAIKRPSAKWTGAITFPDLKISIDGGLYSSSRRGRTPLPVVTIHTGCQTRLPEPDQKPEPEEADAKPDTKPAESGEQAEPAPPALTARQVQCPNCNRPLRADEVGHAIETAIGLVQVTEEELKALTPAATKAVDAQMVREFEGALATIGTGRRFYFLPKPASITDYYRLFAIILRHRVVGFIPELLIDRRPYVLVMRPIITHHSVFGTAMKVIVVDEFLDTDTLRDPREFQLLPASEPDIPYSSLILECLTSPKALDPDQCVNPIRRRLKELVERKLHERKVL